MANEKILIVDDEENLLTMLTRDLELAGYQVFQAKDGHVGFQIVKSMNPDLIISDILMPDMDGNQFMKALRGSQFGDKVPFIILSVREKMQDYFEMMNVDDFITKPYEAADLLDRVAKVLTKARMVKFGQDLKAKKILILDNDEVESVKYQKMLVGQDYIVEVVKTLPECLSGAAILKPNIIALRYPSSQVSDDQLASFLKSVAEMKDNSVILYSKDVGNIEKNKVFDRVTVCMVKEVTEEKLLMAVKKIEK